MTEDHVPVDDPVKRLFDSWGLSQAERAAVVGISLAGEDTIPLRFVQRDLTNEQSTRLGDVFAIYAGLSCLFPENREIRNGWMTSPNRRFGNRRPIDVVVEDRARGLERVRAEIDRMLSG
ncbi:MAG TPA: antitoxin Xre/MbcA/ParS toxin-binding domain-containing protein [Gammaproteobacteria bacterium]|nr:antitoxin Xre/MbcA/ParS toxin-binding domain-containing protein [Gammaproteobacteria bacterium]